MNQKITKTGARKFNQALFFASALNVAKQFGYTSDYITKLAREGKIEAHREGGRWMVNPESVQDFKRKIEEEKSKRAEIIRQERLCEKRKYEAEQNTGNKQLALMQAFVVLILGLTIGTSGYFISYGNLANVNSTDTNVFKNIAHSLFSFFNPDPKETMIVVSQPTMDTVDSRIGTTTHTSLIIAPGEIFTATTVESIESQFSDEVQISVDPNNPDTGIIVPRFRDRDGIEYRYLIVPTPNNNETL